LSDERDYNATLSSFWCLQKLLEYSELEFPNKPLAKTDLTQGKVVLATAPGCQHNLGILVVSDYFRSWGWQSVTLLDTTRELLLQEVRDTSIDFLGLSVGHDAGLKGIPELLQELRLISINPALKIFVGGNIFDLSVEEYDWIGCDCLVTSPQDALQFCSSYTQYKRQ